MKMTSFLVAIFFLLPSLAHGEMIDGIAAVVNGEVITRSELDAAVISKKKTDRREVLDELVDEVLFRQILTEAKIEVSDDDLARAIRNVLSQNHISLEQLKQELAAKGMTYEQYKQQMERDIRQIKFINQTIGQQVKISEQDLRDYFQRHQEKFRAAREAHVAEMVFPLPQPPTQEAFNGAYERANTAVRQSRTNNASFQGNDLGMINLKDVAPEVASTIGTMQIGDISKPILTEQGFVIVKLIALPNLTSADFEKLRDQIYGALYDERVNEALKAHLDKQREKAYVDIR